MVQRTHFSLQPAFVLHARAYRNTSCLLHVLTRDYGRLTVVVRGGRRANYRRKSALQPFIPLYMSCQGKGQLLTLTEVENSHSVAMIQGHNLFFGLYMNELLYALLPESDHSPRLFASYTETILGIANQGAIEPLLRKFERTFLEELGYGLDFYKEADQHCSIDQTGLYYFEPMRGFIKCHAPLAAERHWPGKVLKAIAANDYQDPQVLLAAKWIMRKKIAHLLADKPLHTRRYMQAYTESFNGAV